MFSTNCPAIIIDYPSGRFGFVGRVPEGLHGKSYDTVQDAKVAAIDLMMATGETFPVDIVDSLKSA